MQAQLLVALVALVATLTRGQLTIPPRELGFTYKNLQGPTQVKVAVYIDLTCPDSKASFPTLVQVADQYKPKEVQLKVYLFSLPYHRNSHTISKAAHVLNAYKSSRNATIYDWIGAVYNNIDSLNTASTVNKTDVDVLNFLSALANNVSGISEDEFKAGVANRGVNQATRLQWKYGCTRGVHSTPSFTVNDVFVDADPTWTVSQWTDLINKVLTSN